MGAGGWLKTVTLRLSLNHLSRYRRRWRFFSELLPASTVTEEGSDAEVEFAVDAVDTVFAQLADAQRDECVRTALRRLPDAQRVPLVLFHYEARVLSADRRRSRSVGREGEDRHSARPPRTGEAAAGEWQ